MADLYRLGHGARAKWLGRDPYGAEENGVTLTNDHWNGPARYNGGETLMLGLGGRRCAGGEIKQASRAGQGSDDYHRRKNARL